MPVIICMFRGTKNLLLSFFKYNIATVYQKLQTGIQHDEYFSKAMIMLQFCYFLTTSAESLWSFPSSPTLLSLLCTWLSFYQLLNCPHQNFHSQSILMGFLESLVRVPVVSLLCHLLSIELSHQHSVMGHQCTIEVEEHQHPVSTHSSGDSAVYMCCLSNSPYNLPQSLLAG